MATDVRAAQDAVIGRNLQAWLNTYPAALLGIYWPIRAEPDLRPVYEVLAAAGITLALPVMNGADLPLAFAAWAPGAPLVYDRWGIATPATICPVAPQALLIPCIGFTPQWHRLGYGGGFYDRTLAQQPRPQAIGIAYANTCTTFDIGPYDIAMDVVITEGVPT